MDLQDYLRILRAHWKVIVAATVAGAVLGGALSFLNRPSAAPTSAAPFASAIDLTLLSEKGRRDLANRLSALTATSVRTELALENPSPELSTVDYAQLLLSEETRIAAAAATGKDPDNFAGRVQAVANAETDTITVTVQGVGSEATLADTEALIQAFRDRVRAGQPMDASSRVLITTQSPNPDLETSAGYTESRMPTYAGLATSDVVLAPVAQKIGISDADLRNALSVRIEPNTTILQVGVSGMLGASDPNTIVAQVVDSLQGAIRSIETTPVRFQDLGSASQDSGTRIRSLSLTTSEPQVIVDANGTIPTATAASTLTTLVGEIPTTVASGLGTTTEALTDAELEALAQSLESNSTSADDLTIDVTPLSEVAGAPDSPLKATSIRITAQAADQQSADEIARAAAEVLAQRTRTQQDAQPWPLTLVPTALVVTSETLPVQGTSATQPVDRTTTNIILGLLIGLALGVGYAFLASSRDKTIYSPRQLWEATGEPAFGVIPTSAPSTTWTAINEHDLGGEGYRALRSNVLLGLKDTKVLALVSPVAGTGTHTVGINLAISLAQSGSRVCVVETALSQPRLATLLDAQASPGLAEVITNGADIQGSIQQAPSLGFDVLTAGNTTNDVTDTLTSRKLKDTIDDLRDRYDVVITLCAPAVESPEASAVTPLSDATLIIIRVASTSMTDLEITARVLLQVNTKIAGIIANDVLHEHTDQWRRYLPMGSPQSEAMPN